ncbi:MAG: MotA/TolQ/ExbB proton channel family protein [Planctomycetales bacterium]|nr:MotA/TolQ/ExbB proton channel family protein [Planctomycetales bacterium]
MQVNRRSQSESYTLPLPPVLLLGTILAAGFYGLILSGPLDLAILRRYCLSHPVAIASVSLFFLGLVGLLLKWQQGSRQLTLTKRAAAALRRLVGEGEDIASSQRAAWLAASWQAQPEAIRFSWFGKRIDRTVQLQIKRGKRNQLESDLKWLSETDADRQHESYALLRIINWAMPMLGFLGTVLGISRTLGQLDTQMLATQQQEAMNQLTAGLYVAFDTTAIALVLTVISMFMQFGIQRLETKLQSRIDNEAGDSLIGFLAADPYDAQDTLLGPIREMGSELISLMRRVVEEQAVTWSKSIAESQQQWTEWTQRAAQVLESELGNTVDSALSNHVRELTKLHDDANRQIESRTQQWQTTLSDQARNMQSQQKEISLQTCALQDLVKSTSDLRKLEDVILESITRVENIGRIETAAECIGEAVAVLGTSLERAGIIRGIPIRPRPTQPTHQNTATADSATDTTGNSAAAVTQATSQRKAA